MSTHSTAQPQEPYDLHSAMLLEMIVVTFERAYALAACGMSLEEMLIDFDIQAAASTQQESVSALARTVIKTACSAAQRRIPFDLAFVCIMQRAHLYVAELMSTQQ